MRTMNTTETSEAARKLGSIKTPRKSASARENIAKAREKLQEIIEAGRKALQSEGGDQ